MSRIETFVVRENGDCEGDQEFRNSWGGAMRIWDSVFQRYYHPKPRRSYAPNEEVDSMMELLRDNEASRRFWNLAGDQALPLFARRVFAWTFDNVVLPREEFTRMADDLEQFERALPCDPKNVNHVPALASFLRELASRADVRGLVVNWTSVNSMWYSKPVDPENDETEYRPYNVDVDGAEPLSAIVATT